MQNPSTSAATGNQVDIYAANSQPDHTALEFANGTLPMALDPQFTYDDNDSESYPSFSSSPAASTPESLSDDSIMSDTPSSLATSMELEFAKLNLSPPRKDKSSEEQKRRRSETASQSEMECGLRRRGYRFVSNPLSTQNKKVSGLGNNKQEIMEETIYDIRELENPHAADARLVGEWWKLRYRMKQTPELLLQLANLRSQGLDRHQLEEAQRSLAWKLQTLIPPRYLEIVFLNTKTVQTENIEDKQSLSSLHPLQKRFLRTVRNSSAEKLDGLLIELEKMVKGEMAKWRPTLIRLVIRLLQLRLRLFAIQKGTRFFLSPENYQQSSILLWNLAWFAMWPKAHHKPSNPKPGVRRPPNLRPRL